MSMWFFLIKTAIYDLNSIVFILSNKEMHIIAKAQGNSYGAKQLSQ